MNICIQKRVWIVLVVASFTPLTIYCNPVSSNIDLTNFNDDWDYHTSPSKIPILKTESKTHTLPKTLHREAKEAPDDDDDDVLQTLDLNTGKVGDSVGNLGDAVRSKIPCGVCKLGVSLLQTDIKANVPTPIIKAKFVSLCVGFEIENEVVCNGIFDTFAPDILPVLEVTTLGPKEVCSLLLGEACEKTAISSHEWKVPFPNMKKPISSNKPSTFDPKNPTLKVLQISDTHYDPDYLEGSIANCGEPLCCRQNSSPPKKNGVILPAGKWGAYECDVPKILIENMLSNIVKQHPDIDYIIWTGDIPPHDIWNQTKLQSLDLLKEAVRQMITAFPNIPIFPALGNHEGIPSGNFPPPWNKHENHSISWLYEETSKQWKKWLPESEDSTILHGGFYSVLVRPGLRLISLNMNYCHSFSWWLFVNSTDPAKELKWLVHQLQEAEDNGEKVHIIGHIPPGGTDCLKTWSENYYDIVNRYEHTITAQFFGHSHADEFEVFYDNENYSRPINVAYIGPSVTPYSGQNPAYRIYYVDGEHKDATWEIIDHETWIMDLDRANTELEENPNWYMLYSARDTYGMSSLRPLEWGKLIQKMARNTKLFDKFYRLYNRDSPTTPEYTDKEKLQILCDLKSGKSQDRHHLCHDLEVLFT